MTSEWKPPAWMHKAKTSDTSFLEPKKLNHGKLDPTKDVKSRGRKGKASDSVKNDKTTKVSGAIKSENKPVPSTSILAIIQMQEFEELFDELFELERDKIKFIVSVGREIDILRQRIAVLCGETMKRNPSQQSYLQSFLSLFSFNRSEERNVCEPITKARFNNLEAMEERIQQIKRTKIVLVQQTAKEIETLRNIVKCLEHINHETDHKRPVDKSTWSFLWWLLAAIVVGFTIPVI